MCVQKCHVSGPKKCSILVSNKRRWACHCANLAMSRHRNFEKYELSAESGISFFSTAVLMAPPNPFWVQRYLRDHNLDALLAEAVNQVCGPAPGVRAPAASRQLASGRHPRRVGLRGLTQAVVQAVEQRSTDPAASLAQYFTMLSKRNGEVTKISARRTFNRSAPMSLFQTLKEKRARSAFLGGQHSAAGAMHPAAEMSAAGGSFGSK